MRFLFAFLGFHKWSHSHTFLLHFRVFVHAFLLPQTYDCCCCYSKSLEVGFIMATRGATMMIVEIDSPTFPLITFIIRGKSRKNEGLPEPVGKIAETSWPRRRRFKQISSLETADVFPVVASEGEKRRPEVSLLFACQHIFCSSRKNSTYRKCSIALFLVVSMSSWFDNRCLSPSISHSSSMTLVLEC